LLVDKVASKEITIQNSSLVPTSFQIESVSDDGKDPSFSLSQTKGAIAPGQSSKITVKYTPRIPNVTSCQYWKVTANGGNELRFSAKGVAEGYKVELSVSSVHFGEVQIET